jgi:hypothetical protein
MCWVTVVLKGCRAWRISVAANPLDGDGVPVALARMFVGEPERGTPAVDLQPEHVRHHMTQLDFESRTPIVIAQPAVLPDRGRIATRLVLLLVRDIGIAA